MRFLPLLNPARKGCAELHAIRKRGRPKVHGKRFAFKEADTWGTPDAVVELEDPRWGNVCLERWNQLHETKGTDVL